MGMENINKAKCDKCNRTEYSVLKQAAFMEKLKQKGWSGNVNKLYCPSCNKDSKVYNGKFSGLKWFGGKCYVHIVNPNVGVYIPIEELFPKINAKEESISNELIEQLLSANGINAKKIHYTNSHKKKIEEKEFFVATYCKNM